MQEKTRQDPVKQQRERQHDCLSHMDSRRQELDAAAHRQICQSPQKGRRNKNKTLLSVGEYASKILNEDRWSKKWTQKPINKFV